MRRLVHGQRNLLRDKAWVIAVLFVFLAKPANSECLGPSAIQAARSIFEDHRDFVFGSMVPDFLTPPLAAALEANLSCRDLGESCAIDWDPWTDAQDGEIGGPVAYAVNHLDSKTARISVTFSFPGDLRPGERAERRTVVLQFQRDVSRKCWLLADLISKGTDLRVVLSRNFGLPEWQKFH